MKPKYQIYYFDVDGTLTDSSVPLTTFCNDLNSKLKLGLPSVNPLDSVAVKRLMKTPMEALLETYGFPKGRISELMEIYRTEYSKDERYHAELFEGVPELLTDLSSMREVYLKYLTHNSLANVKRDLGEVFKKFQSGYDMESIDRFFCSTKAKALKADLKKHLHIHPKSAVMIGDTINDYLAAKSSGCDFVAVNYGFGTWEDRRELKVANTVKELRDFLIE